MMFTPVPDAANDLIPLRYAAAVAGMTLSVAYDRVHQGHWPGVIAGERKTWHVPRTWLPSIPLVEEQLRQRRAQQVDQDLLEALESSRETAGPRLLAEAHELLVRFERVLSAAQAGTWPDVRGYLTEIHGRLLALTDAANHRALAAARRAQRDHDADTAPAAATRAA